MVDAGNTPRDADVTPTDALTTREQIRECSGRLVGGTISGDVFSDSSCADIEFERCTFVSNFRVTDFSGSTFKNCVFKFNRFASCLFEKSMFEQSRLFEVSRRAGCEFLFCDMDFVCFRSCNLSSSKFESCSMYAVEMQECNMQGSTFKKVSFTKSVSKKKILNLATISRCNLRFSDLEGIKLNSCVLLDCLFEEANLNFCDLSNADLSGSVVSRCEMQQANLKGTNITGGRLEGVSLTDLVDYRGLRISADQQEGLLRGIGIFVVND